MTSFEYALGLLAILMSLALADMVMCLHRLLRNARTVIWDGRILVATALVVIEILRIWFAQWSLREAEIALTFPVYAGLFAHILLLVLLAAACLPDDVGERCDLGDYYDNNRRYFWGVFATYQCVYFVMWATLIGGSQSSVGGEVTPIDWIRMLMPLAAYLLLAFVRRPVLDYGLPLLIILFYLWRYSGQTLAA